MLPSISTSINSIIDTIVVKTNSMVGERTVDAKVMRDENMSDETIRNERRLNDVNPQIVPPIVENARLFEVASLGIVLSSVEIVRHPEEA